jgi:segregation and condensation protein A
VIKLHGQPLEQLPKDLFIPPDALQVFLQAFEGPLDLLLYLIRKQNFDILDIPVGEVARQYGAYIESLQALRFELAAEYLVMAAMLAEIKSRLLLPRLHTPEGVEEDPRAELIRRLQEYERFKAAAESLDVLPRLGRDWFIAQAAFEHAPLSQRLPAPTVQALLDAYVQVLQRAALRQDHTLHAEPLSLQAKMKFLLWQMGGLPVRFETLLAEDEGQAGVIVSFLAVLELVRQGQVQLSQAEPFAPVLLWVVSDTLPEIFA